MPQTNFTPGGRPREFKLDERKADKTSAATLWELKIHFNGHRVEDKVLSSLITLGLIARMMVSFENIECKVFWSSMIFNAKLEDGSEIS